MYRIDKADLFPRVRFPENNEKLVFDRIILFMEEKTVSMLDFFSRYIVPFLCLL